MDYLGPILDPPGPPPGSGPPGEVSCAPREATRGGRDNLWHFSAKHLNLARLKLSKTSQKRLKMVILEGFGRGLGGVWRGVPTLALPKPSVHLPSTPSLQLRISRVLGFFKPLRGFEGEGEPF